MPEPHGGRAKFAAKLRRHSRRPKPTSQKPPAPRKPGPPAEARADGQSSDQAERLQKILAAAGIGSRRKCEELITAGRVTIDGETVMALGTKVDPDVSEVAVDGEPIKQGRRLYYMVNKPGGVVSTSRDPSGRPRVIDLLPAAERLFTVGRLDLSSEGLILVTNDGELADLLTHPRYGVEKVYHVQIAGRPEPEVLEQLRKGVHLAEGFAHAKRVSVKSQHKQSTILEMVLDEGKNREVRRLLAKVGHKVMWLRRVALGPLRLGNLPAGEFRPLRREEVAELRAAARRPGGSTAVAQGAPVETRANKPLGHQPKGHARQGQQQRGSRPKHKQKFNPRGPSRRS